MIEHMQHQLVALLLAQRATSPTPAPPPHPTTPTPTWSTPGVPKTDIPPLPSAAIKALMEAATLTPINVMSFYLSLFAQIRSLGAELAPGLLLPPSSTLDMLRQQYTRRRRLRGLLRDDRHKT